MNGTPKKKKGYTTIVLQVPNQARSKVPAPKDPSGINAPGRFRTDLSADDIYAALQGNSRR